MRQTPPRSLTSLCLAAGVHAVAIHDDLVFLDIGRDAYACLPGGALMATVSPDRSGLSPSSSALLAQVRAAGLIAAGPVARSPWVPPPPPAASALPLSIAPPRWSDAPDAIAVLIDVLRLYWRRPFTSIVANVRTRPATRRGAARALDEVVARFHNWVPYAPVSGKCLLRSFMLLRLLQRYGYDARWVFGVATWPFLAHCWVQVDDIVLDDDVERLTGLHPILVV